MGHINVAVCLCELCGHRWLSSSEELPARCAKCKSSQWDGQETREPGRPKKIVMQTVETSIGPREIISEKPARIDRQSLADALPNTTLGVKEGMCPHHKMKGEVCYKCDHKFGMPALR